ncbi:MAG: 5'/3'-nucleotidase SurE [Pirellulaceae bacterium]|nr:5'/3'-nucleotidase SurE [Pirellulaceae bacterium]
MRILLTNDDGVYAPGLAALEHELQSVGDVCVVAPATEQSGVGHSITFLRPLVCTEAYEGNRFRGWAVEGSPADCVKIGLFEFCRDADLVVSGINGGLNAGINVLYSGTVAAAIEGAFYGITSFAVSLEFAEHFQFERAARLARQVIERVLEEKSDEPELVNINIPTAALEGNDDIRVVPMGVARYGEHFLRRQDPKGRNYYWATTDPPPKPTDQETDLTALEKGFVTVTPLQYDMTKPSALEQMRSWSFSTGESR